MNRRKSVLYALTALLTVVAADGGGGSGGGYEVGKGLRFSSSGSFRIALFAHLHYGENAWDDWGPKQDVKFDMVLSSVLDQEMSGLRGGYWKEFGGLVDDFQLLEFKSNSPGLVRMQKWGAVKDHQPAIVPEADLMCWTGPGEVHLLFYNIL